MLHHNTRNTQKTEQEQKHTSFFQDRNHSSNFLNANGKTEVNTPKPKLDSFGRKRTRILLEKQRSRSTVTKKEAKLRRLASNEIFKMISGSSIKKLNRVLDTTKMVLNTNVVISQDPIPNNNLRAVVFDEAEVVNNNRIEDVPELKESFGSSSDSCSSGQAPNRESLAETAENRVVVLEESIGSSSYSSSEDEN